MSDRKVHVVMEEKMDSDGGCCDKRAGHWPGTIEVRFTPDEVLALYALLVQRMDDKPCGSLECSDEDDPSVPLSQALSRIKARLLLSMQVTAALARNRRTRPLTELISAALAEGRDQEHDIITQELRRRYLRGQQLKIDALRDQHAGIDQQAQEGQAQESIEVGQLADDAMVEVDLDPFGDDEPVREYPRRRPPEPVMPAMPRRRARRRGRAHHAGPAQV